MVECKSRLARLCPSLPIIEASTTAMANAQPTSVNVERIGQFVAALLDEYDSLKRVCRKIYPAVEHLVSPLSCVLWKLLAYFLSFNYCELVISVFVRVPLYLRFKIPIS